MLKDVGMTVLNTIETCMGAVCGQRHGHEKTRCSIMKQRQRIIASNHNPIIKDVGRGYTCYCWMNGRPLYVHVLSISSFVLDNSRSMHDACTLYITVCIIKPYLYVGYTLQKRGGCFDQCVWSPQLHYMTITCLGIQRI